MKFDNIDIRLLGATEAEKVLISAAQEGDGDAVFLIGHGSNGGRALEDLSEAQLCAHDDWRFMWLHACLCGRHLIEPIAETGRTAVGFVVNVLVNPDGDGKAKLFTDVEGRLEAIEADAPCEEILSEVRSEWFGLAEEEWEKENLFDVAIINQHRLSIRCCSGKT